MSNVLPQHPAWQCPCGNTNPAQEGRCARCGQTRAIESYRPAPPTAPLLVLASCLACVSGLIAGFVLPAFFAPLGIVLGVIGWKQSLQPPNLGGKIMAGAGIIGSAGQLILSLLPHVSG